MLQYIRTTKFVFVFWRGMGRGRGNNNKKSAFDMIKIHDMSYDVMDFC